MERVQMDRIHMAMLKANKKFIELIDGFGYIYQSGNALFVINGKGIAKL